MASRRHSSPSAPPLDDDNLLREIVLRLPPLPSSLPRVSTVCKSWRHLLSDPRFLRRFRIHHPRNPPLLGFFVIRFSGLSFVPTMEAPNRAPPGRLSLQFDHSHLFRFYGCRNGLVLISGQTRHQFFVWDAVTGDKHQLPFPPWFDPNTTTGINAAVLRAAGDVHFQVVFVATYRDTQQALACLYSSKTGVWDDLISTTIPSEVPNVYPDILSLVSDVLVGDSLYWVLVASSSILEAHAVLEFDLKRQSLAVIPVPVNSMFKAAPDKYMVMRVEGGGFGFLSLSAFTAKLWKRKIDCDGVDSWVLGRTIELDKLLSLNTRNGSMVPLIRGFAENNNVVFVGTDICVFMVNLESLKFKNLFETNISPYYHPLKCVYTAGIGGGHDAIDVLHNT